MAKATKTKLTQADINRLEGRRIIDEHPLFGRLVSDYNRCSVFTHDKNAAAFITTDGYIIYNSKKLLEPDEWAFISAHLLLHLGLGHTNGDKVPKGINIRAWNTACDIYVTRFLMDIKFPGAPMEAYLIDEFPGSLKDEMTIYRELADKPELAMKYAVLGTNGTANGDIYDFEKIWVKPQPSKWYRPRIQAGDYYEKEFGLALQHAVHNALMKAGGNDSADEEKDGRAKKASKWFINSYPLLGGLAAHFKIIEDHEICHKEEIKIAAINVDLREIYVNPAAKLSEEELKFVLAHEYLHAGLDHAGRRNGRDAELWNVACDYVINGWLSEMKIGSMPEEGLLYDEGLKGMSAEEIYDDLVRNLRTARKLATFRGYEMGDILGGGMSESGRNGKGVTLDEYCRNALMQGLVYQISTGRGLVPEGLIEEIRALQVPPIPWDVKLARWFDDYFAPLEKKRTYARPSRRQASTPDIPRPRYYLDESMTEGRTFGVVIDTSGSMSARQIGLALGAIASYADAKDVPKARVIFCDAAAYDAGYMSPEEIAGRVNVQGRGGTILQPAVDLLENAKDFPKDGPILIITDGYIESDLRVKRDHAFLLPKGNGLPFRPKGKVFYFEEE